MAPFYHCWNLLPPLSYPMENVLDVPLLAGMSVQLLSPKNYIYCVYN